MSHCHGRVLSSRATVFAKRLVDRVNTINFETPVQLLTWSAHISCGVVVSDNVESFIWLFMEFWIKPKKNVLTWTALDICQAF